MTWEVAVAGTLHRDDITTPHGRHTVLGGSAVYFALAAATYAPTVLSGITGRDTAAAYAAMLDDLDVDLAGLEVSDAPTVLWHVDHDFEHWVTRSESAEPGCDAEWSAELGDRARAAPVLFLASCAPEKQLAAVRDSSARLIGADSMNVFMGANPGVVADVAARADVLFLNEAELRALTGSADWRAAAPTLCGRGRLRAVVVKRGPEGAACVTRERVFELPAVPVARVIDPTGAGDALAGGFLGRCAQLERDDEDVFEDALGHGVRCAARAIAAFGVEALLQGFRPAGARGPRDV